VADTDSEQEESPLPTYRPVGTGSADVLRMEDISRMIDSHTAAHAWSRYRSGEANVFIKRLYSLEGQGMFDQIVERYQNSGEFRGTVEQYVSDFEQLIHEAEEKDPSGRIIQNYLTSESGRVYLVLAHASGRLS
jgi:hypothetical protein